MPQEKKIWSRSCIEDVFRDAEIEAKKYPDWMLVGNTIPGNSNEPKQPLHHRGKPKRMKRMQ